MVNIYKSINAWGDGIYAKEFYNVPQESVIDNGFIKSDESITDETILSYFGIAPAIIQEVEEEVVPSQPETETDKIQPEGLPSIDNTNENSCK
jgi:hypothetical protein